jgi:ferredoxin
MAAVVKPEICEGCGACVDTCPSGAIELKDGKAVVDAELCGDCGACVDACPTQAIEIP